MTARKKNVIMVNDQVGGVRHEEKKEAIVNLNFFSLDYSNICDCGVDYKIYTK